MLSLNSSDRFILYFHTTDMRKSFDSLCELIHSELEVDPTDGTVYVFVNRLRNKIKLLHWQSDGFILYYKRLEKGTLQLPKYDDSVLRLSLDCSGMILLIDGIIIANISRVNRYKKK
jgi:transposase